jgi:two-component system, chemotaxis family, sensor kinase CheA
MDLELDINDFIVEVEEQLTFLNDGLLDLEKNTNDSDVINDIFRSAHTIKGAAGMFGFDEMMKLTHGMENIFDQVREGNYGLTSDDIDSLFEVLDTLNKLMEEVPSGKFETNTKKSYELIDEIIASKKNDDNNKKTKKEITVNVAKKEEKAFLETQNDVSKESNSTNLMKRNFSEEEQNAYLFAQDGSYNIFSLKVRINKDAAMPSIVSYMIISNIKELGVLIAVDPTEEILNEDETKDFMVLFATTEKIDSLKEKLLFPDTDEIDIRPIDDLQSNPDNNDKNNETIEKEIPQSNLQDDIEEPQNLVIAEKEIKKQPVQKEIRDASQSIRVDSNKLDFLLNMAGELVISRAGVTQSAVDLEKTIGRTKQVVKLKDTVNQLMRITTQIQEGIMQLRMMPIAGVFNKYPRVVRDISRKINKEIELIIEGKETELDKSIVEKITDPLMHILRNAVDHGIELPEEREKKGKDRIGTICLRAFHRGSFIIIEVEDDGKGINPEIIKNKCIEKGLLTEVELESMSEKEIIEMVLAPGFSTAETVSDLSGRGVGMDVVKRNIDELKGAIEIESTVDKGSLFSIKLPLTLAIIPALLTYVHETLYAIPLVNIIEILDIKKENVNIVIDEETLRVRDEIIKLLRMDEVFGEARYNREKASFQAVIVAIGEKKIALAVDELLDEQDIVVKSLDKDLAKSITISGATILGNGKIALIADISSIIEAYV